jgi:hypothetical protein
VEESSRASFDTLLKVVWVELVLPVSFALKT